MIDNEMITDPSKIVEQFNDFFVNIGPNLACKIDKNNCNLLSYLSEQNKNSLFASPVDEQELLDVIKSLRCTSPGWNKIDSSFLKAILHTLIAKSLCHLYNYLSFNHGIFPKEFKLAEVIPLFTARLSAWTTFVSSLHQ